MDLGSSLQQWDHLRRRFNHKRTREGVALGGRRRGVGAIAGATANGAQAIRARESSDAILLSAASGFPLAPGRGQELGDAAVGRRVRGSVILNRVRADIARRVAVGGT